MPAFNEERYIRESINSVLDQTHENWELLVIDDGSEDRTSSIASSFDDARISLFTLVNNQGVSAARNVGLKHSKGEYITFLDADDMLPPQSLESRLNVLTSRPNISFADGRVAVFNSDMTKKITNWTPGYRGRPFHRLIAFDGSCFYGLTWLIKKAVLSNMTFNPSMTHGEDLLYLMQICHCSAFEYSFTGQEILQRRTGHESAMKDLPGLELGYKELYARIKDFNNISEGQANLFKRRAQSIMVKCYLKQLDLKGVHRVLVSKW